MPAWLTVPEIIKIVIIVLGLVVWGIKLETKVEGTEVRVIQAEHAIHQETLGYREIQKTFAERLNRIEDKAESDRRRIEAKLDQLIASSRQTRRVP